MNCSMKWALHHQENKNAVQAVAWRAPETATLARRVSAMAGWRWAMTTGSTERGRDTAWTTGGGFCITALGQTLSPAPRSTVYIENMTAEARSGGRRSEGGDGPNLVRPPRSRRARR